MLNYNKKLNLNIKSKDLKEEKVFEQTMKKLLRNKQLLNVLHLE